jgi:GSH-dependent disulfide-bond oxidoreductase
MIDLHTVATPNGHKVSIMLEETGLPYEIIPYNIFDGDQFKPEFLALNPNNKLPVIVDNDPLDGGEPITVFETGAILIYLADKTGRFLSLESRARYQAIQWVMWQMSGLGPMHGQAHHFIRYAPEDVENRYAHDRYLAEARRLLKVMESRLAEEEYLAGDYSIADMACWPWVRATALIDLSLDSLPNIKRWFDDIDARPAVQTGSNVINDYRNRIINSDKVPLTPEQWSVLFGARQREDGV